MSQALKIDERAFNRGVEEVLKLKPLVRIVKGAISEAKVATDRPGKGLTVDKRKPR